GTTPPSVGCPAPIGPDAPQPAVDQSTVGADRPQAVVRPVGAQCPSPSARPTRWPIPQGTPPARPDLGYAAVCTRRADRVSHGGPTANRPVPSVSPCPTCSAPPDMNNLGIWTTCPHTLRFTCPPDTT